MNDRFRHFIGAEESIEWAKAAILEFGQLTSSALGLEPQEVTHKLDVKFRFTKPVPALVRRKATEALIHARHSFDQALFAAHEAIEPGRNYSKKFPWAEDADDQE